MPKIPVYDANVNPEAPLPGRSPERLYAEPQSFGAGSGLEHIGQGVMETAETLYNAEQTQEVSNVRAQMATARGVLTAQFEKAASTAQPGDASFTDKFLQSVDDHISTIGQSIQTKAGQRAYQQESAALKADFLARGTEFTVQSAGAKAVADWHSTVNNYAGTLFNDPTQAASVFQSIDNAVKDPAGPFANVPASQKAELALQAKEQLAIAAGRGVAMMNPDLAEKEYKAGSLPGQSFLTEAGNAQMVSYINTEQNAARTKQALAIAQQERAERLNDEAAGRQVVSHLLQSPNDPGAVDYIMAHVKNPEKQLYYLTLAGHSIQDQAHDQNTYGQGFYQAYQGIQNGTIKTMDQLTSQVGPNGTLSLAGVNVLTNELIGRRTPEGQMEAQLKDGFVKAFGQQLSGTNELLHLRDPKGDEMKQAALAAFLPAYEKAKEEGKYPPQVLLDPKNPHSLWPLVMGFKRDPNTMMRDLLSSNPGADLGTATPAPKTKTVSFGALPK